MELHVASQLNHSSAHRKEKLPFKLKSKPSLISLLFSTTRPKQLIAHTRDLIFDRKHPSFLAHTYGTHARVRARDSCRCKAIGDVRATLKPRLLETS